MHPPYPVVAAIIRHEQKILCGQRGQTKYPYTSYHWEFPGGKVEAGESPQLALQREIREELGLEIEVGELCLQHTHTYPDFSISLSAYYCTTQVPEALTLTEHVAFQWLEAGELNNLTWAAADEPVVEKINNDKPTTVWMFHGAGSQFSGGVFTSLGQAEAWIQLHGLTGILTQYPLNDGVYDWALRKGLFKITNEKHLTARFIGGFNSASQQHFHYENGQREGDAY